MKTVFINKKQQGLLKEALQKEQMIMSLPTHLKQDIVDGECPLSDSPSFYSSKKQLLKLLSQKQQDIINEFSDDITQIPLQKVCNKLNKLSSICIQKEENIKEQLCNICYNAIVDSFNIPDDAMEFELDLVPEISPDKQFRITPDTNEEYEYNDVNEITSENGQIEKRNLINALVIGGANYLSKEIFKKCLPDIFELDSELPHLYKKIMKLNDYVLFVQKIKIEDNNHKQGGYSNVKLGNDLKITKVNVEAVNFPILLNETIKGCLDVIAAQGLPDSISEAESIMGKTDILRNEPWYMIVGPVLWENIFGNMQSNEVPYAFSELVKEEPEEFFDITKEIFAHTSKGNELVKEITKFGKYQSQYNSFQNDLKTKQENSKTLIDDDYPDEYNLCDENYM